MSTESARGPGAEFLEERRVRLTPIRRDDLRRGIAEWVDGDAFTVMRNGIVEHDCPYTGQPRWTPIMPDPHPPMTWVAECDLTFVD